MKWTLDKTEESFERICKHISDGNSLISGLELHDTPTRNTFYKWIDHELHDNPSEETIYLCNKRLEQYTRARVDRSDFIFEEILEIADEGKNDFTTNKDGIEVVNHENIQRARLRVDARKWMLGKMQPKKYGDKIDVTTGGEKLPAAGSNNMNISLPDGTNIDEYIDRVKEE